MTEPARCFVCQNYTQGTGKLRLGLGNCKLMAKWTFPNPFKSRADCVTFEQVADDQLAARLKWESSK